jgi:hypothetical protein
MRILVERRATMLLLLLKYCPRGLFARIRFRLRACQGFGAWRRSGSGTPGVELALSHRFIRRG